MRTATEVLEGLIHRMGEASGPVEEVIGEWSGQDVELAVVSASKGAPRVMANSVVAELGETWGNTGDPTWVDGLVPGRDDLAAPEQDFMFALYRRPRIYAYARLRGDADPPTRLQMILGVIRKPPEHWDD